MLPSQIILPLQDSLAVLTTGWGVVSLAADPFNVFEQLSTGPNSLLVILHWGGDAGTSSTRRSPFVKNVIEVYVGRNKGLSLDPNETLYREDIIDGAAPLSEQVAQVREHLRAFDYNPQPGADTRHERYLSYAGCEPVILPSGLPMAAYKLRFDLNTSLPTI